MKYFNVGFLLGLSFFSLNINAAQIDSAAHIAIPKTTDKIVIDANLNEVAWEKATKVNLDYIVWPDENIPSPVKTEAFIIEDGGNLHIAFKAYDPNPELIRAYLSDRDRNWQDDRVGVKIDTYHDHSLAYQFFVNPLGVQADAIENEITKQESDAWNVIWDSAGKITEYGYVVEMTIPLRVLNFDDSLDKQSWGIEFVRFYPRNKKYRISNTTIDQNDPCWICQMTVAEGLSGAKQGNNFTAIPTLVSGHSETRDVSIMEDWQESANTEVGLDLKWGITPDITMNATFNPDFSQVEADSGQLNVNNTFALFTPERRSFFLSNQDSFATPMNLVYTRNINAPDHGIKLTGKLSQHSFGAFIANDQTTRFLMPGNLGSGIFELDESTENGVLRYRYDANSNSSIGGITTFRKSDSYHNYVHSVDLKHKFSQQDTLNVQIMNSDTFMTDQLITEVNSDVSSEQQQRLLTINSTDQAYMLNFEHRNKDSFFRFGHTSIGKDFRADLAFFNNSDHEKTVIGGGVNWLQTNPDGWWNRIEVNGDIDRTVDQKGDELEREAEIWLNINSIKDGFIRHGLVVRDKVASRIDEKSLTIAGNSTSFTEQEFRSWIEFKPVSSLWIGNFLKIGKNIDYANNQLADSFNLEPRFTWNLGQHLSTSLTYRYNRLDKDNNNLYIAKLMDFRVTYQFSIRSFLRYTLVHSDVTRNLNNYNVDVRGDYNEHYESLASQLLFSYKLNPQTLFFLGYADGGYQDDSLQKVTKDQKNIFMKLSYAYQM